MAPRTSWFLFFSSILVLLLEAACAIPDRGAERDGAAKRPPSVEDDRRSALGEREPVSSATKMSSAAEEPFPVDKSEMNDISAQRKSESSASRDKVELVYGDIVMAETADAMKEGEVEAVVFPHWFHRMRFRCKVCHEDTFKSDKGANKIDMDSISAGESCGVCHDGTVAWDALECENCHFYPFDQIEQPDKAEAQEPKDPAEILFAGRSGKIAGKGDRRNPVGSAFKWGSGWKPRALALAGLPRDRFGLVDWVALTRKGMVLPKGSLDPDDPAYESPVRYEFDEEGDEDIEDILIPVKSDTISAVVFPHTLHAWWLNCKSCHPRRFTRTAGETRMTMKEMAKGKYCGECHGKVAFPLEDCSRCHDKKKAEECKVSDSCIS